MVEVPALKVRLVTSEKLKLLVVIVIVLLPRDIERVLLFEEASPDRVMA